MRVCGCSATVASDVLRKFALKKIIIFHAVFTHYISFMLLKKEIHINSGISMYKRECWGGISCLAIAFVMVKGSRRLKPLQFAGLEMDARARCQGFFWPRMSHWSEFVCGWWIFPIVWKCCHHWLMLSLFIGGVSHEILPSSCYRKCSGGRSKSKGR